MPAPGFLNPSTLKMPLGQHARNEAQIRSMNSKRVKASLPRLLQGIAGIVALGASQLFSADLTPAQTQFFENKIRPVLADNCYKCHSQSAEKVKGGLLLDTKDGL